MPKLDTSLHLEMYRSFRRRRAAIRLKQVARAILRPPIYGLEWGDPESSAPLEYAGAVNDIETPRVKKLESRRDRSSWRSMGRWNGKSWGAVDRPR